jgi:hypothetical protein
VMGALVQEAIDVAVIVNALRASRVAVGADVVALAPTVAARAPRAAQADSGMT